MYIIFQITSLHSDITSRGSNPTSAGTITPYYQFAHCGEPCLSLWSMSSCCLNWSKIEDFLEWTLQLQYPPCISHSPSPQSKSRIQFSPSLHFFPFLIIRHVIVEKFFPMLHELFHRHYGRISYRNAMIIQLILFSHMKLYNSNSVSFRSIQIADIESIKVRVDRNCCQGIIMWVDL